MTNTSNAITNTTRNMMTNATRDERGCQQIRNEY
jgi:hypothetical protein